MKHHQHITTVSMLVVLAGCAGNSPHVYKLYPGAERPDAELATLELGDRVCRATVDGLQVNCLDYGSVKLAPGRHCIDFSADFAVSYLVNSDMRDSVSAAGCATLEAGRTYVLRGDRTTGRGYTMFAWIEDAETGVFLQPEESP
ncbi:MAG: hypothetical protein R3288_07575 [Woeseiaceae bacterium]|nr:hypothetical protein [Woeseiaceae bacterium]